LLSEEQRQALARDAVRGEARRAEGPFWWETSSDCETAPSQPPAQVSATERIVYETDNSAARDLAERFVGIGSIPRAAGLSGEALAQALRRGNESGYVLSIDRRPLDPCRDLRVLVESAGWIDLRTIIPLVDTRLQAIVRRGHSSMTADWDGTLFFGGASK
jgi:hypothetical protein